MENNDQTEVKNASGTDSNAQTKKKKSGFIGKFVGFSVATWIGAALSLFITPVATRIFDPAELGMIHLFQTTVMLIMYLAMLGLHQGYIRYYNEPPEGFTKQSLYKYCLFISCAFTLLIDAGILVMWKRVSLYIGNETSMLIPVCLALSVMDYVILTFSSNAFRMQQNTLGYNIQQLGVVVSTKVAYILAIIISPTHQYGILFMTALFTIWTIGTLIFRSKMLAEASIRKLPPSSKKQLFAYSLPWIPVLFVSYLNTNLPQYLLNSMADKTSVGIYGSAATIVSIVTIVQAGFNIFWTPYVYQNYREKPQNIRKVHEIIVPFMITFFIGVLLFQDVIYLLLGEKYRQSRSYLGFLLASPVLYTIAETTGLGINISKKSYFNLLTSVISILVNLGISYFTIPKMGAIGAAVAVMTAALVMLVTKTLIGEKYFKVLSHPLRTGFAVLLMTAGAVISWRFSENFAARTTGLLIIEAILLFCYRTEAKFCIDRGIKSLKSILNLGKEKNQ